MRLNSILIVALAALLLGAVVHAYGLQLTGQCISRIDMARSQWVGLLHYIYNLWRYDFTGAGTVQLIIRADVSSDAPLNLVLSSQERRILTIGPSTRIVGTHTVDLKAPGAYMLFIENLGIPGNFTFFIDVTMCGNPAVESWLRQYIAPISTTPGTIMAPMGIASYGVTEVGGRYFTYELTTDAVKGIVNIPPNISVSGYRGNNYYYGRAFSVRLSAFVVARLMDGTVQYYKIQNIVGFDENHEWLEVRSSIWNATGNNHPTPILGKSAVWGNGAVYSGPYGYFYKYVMPNSIPFGRVELEMRAYAADGKIIVEFYANGQMYDKVVITPYAPAISAYIKVAPTTTPRGLPLDLMLVFGGYDIGIPWAFLNAGQIGLELYVRMNGAWVPPPSAWSVGYGTAERSYASVVPQGVGSAIVKPGPPNSQQLWAGTIIATPLGFNITASTDLSPYARSPIDLGNGTRLVLTGVYVNGRPAQSLSNVPLGSIVVLQYERQYLISTSTSSSYAAGRFNEGSTIVLLALAAVTAAIVAVTVAIAAIVVLFRKLRKLS